MESSSIDIVICISRSAEFPSVRLFEEISRVLKPGGTILIHRTSQSATGETDKVIGLEFCDCMKLVCSESLTRVSYRQPPLLSATYFWQGS